MLTQEECNAQAGQYQGNFTGCDPNNCTTIKGACCFDDGTCVVVEAASLFEDCIQLGGFYQGDGTFCNADQCLGACCLPDGSCVDQIPRAECQNVLLGSWQGLGVLCGDIVCPPTKGACCLSNGDCLNDVTEAECTAANGIDFEVGVTCAEKDCDVPCCVPDDPCCIKVSLDECVAQNGIAGPVGVSCEDYECPTQACCFDDGSCQDLTCEECVALGGRTQGFGSSCATTICCDGAIGDFIWLDNSFAGSCNGKQDAGEPGIAGVVVTLYRQLADGSLEFVQQTVTNSSGHYLFSGPDICAGDYCVEVQTPMGLYPTTPFAGTDPAKDSDCFNGLACLTLPTSVSEDLTIDCGFCMPEDCCEPDKPKALTFRYTGEDCSASDNTQGQ